MGISVATAVTLAREIRNRGLHGRLVTLGRQDCMFHFDELLVAMADRGLIAIQNNTVSLLESQVAVVDAYRHKKEGLSFRKVAAEAGHISDQFFFRFMGFESVISVDYSDYEGALVSHDLNQPGLGALVGENDLVYDGGTLEHVFHTPNALRNIFEALKVGGFVIHHSPSNNHVDHGFYQFSPTLFYDYYVKNGFGDVKIRFGRGLNGLEAGMDYFPGSLDAISAGGLDGATYGVECIAQKLPTSTCHLIPQQRSYVRNWLGGPS